LIAGEGSCERRAALISEVRAVPGLDVLFDAWNAAGDEAKDRFWEALKIAKRRHSLTIELGDIAIERALCGALRPCHQAPLSFDMRRAAVFSLPVASRSLISFNRKPKEKHKMKKTFIAAALALSVSPALAQSATRSADGQKVDALVRKIVEIAAVTVPSPFSPHP
jgi:hypothetical protein